MVMFGCQINSFGNVEAAIEACLRAEKSGFNLVTLPDHLFHPLDKLFLPEPAWDAYVILSYVAARTKELKLGPGVSDVIRRHPATLLNEVVTLDHASQGRAFLALGAGEIFNFYPLKEIEFKRPVKRLEEAIMVIRSLLASTQEHPAYFEGEFYKLSSGYLGLKPYKGRKLPIYVGGYGPRMLRLVATLSDGWIPWMNAPEQFEDDLREVKKMASEAGRDPDEIEALPIVFSDIDIDGEAAKVRLLTRTKVCLALRKRLLERLGLKNIAEVDLWNTSLVSEDISRVYKIAGLIPDEVALRVMAAGHGDEVIGVIERFVKAGATAFIMEPPIERIFETIEAYGRWVIPYFRDTSRA
ncbi:Phthiodiolone/phenolphthiodiolone dimycocerosates ketoreductase [Candidatus Calditenuaceae archaeon HR02]|nr:Phthiodiolone/phenolphthiodiolone dimycocerosates ketoreductase [Candidatus Calditenuaceae archaeon HR02]